MTAGIAYVDGPRLARSLAVLGARGNSGMMLAHFLLGFTESLGQRPAARWPWP